MSYNNEFLARYGSDKHVRELIANGDYAASQEMHKNPTLNADTLLQLHLKGASQSAKTRSLEHPNFTHHKYLNLKDFDVQYHSLNNDNLHPDVIRTIHDNTKNSGIRAKVYEHPNCPIDVHDQAFKDGVPSSQVASAVSNKNCPVHRLTDPKNLDHDSPSVLSGILKNPNTPVNILVKRGIESDMKHEKEAALVNPSTPYKHVSDSIRGTTLSGHVAIYNPNVTREDFDHYAARTGHSVYHLPEKHLEKFYPNGYLKSLNTVKNT